MGPRVLHPIKWAQQRVSDSLQAPGPAERASSYDQLRSAQSWPVGQRGVCCKAGAADPCCGAEESRAPDFKGAGVVVASTMDSAGSVFAGEFAEYVAEEQKNHALTLEQQGLWASRHWRPRAIG